MIDEVCNRQAPPALEMAVMLTNVMQFDMMEQVEPRIRALGSTLTTNTLLGAKHAMAASQDTIVAPEYKNLAEWPGYGVDDHGNVWTCRKYGGGCLDTKRKLIPWSKPSGHLCVSLRRDGKTYKKMVHQLVLETFVGPCPENMEGCHGEEGTKVNGLWNLRWDTHQENHKDRFRHGEPYGKQKLSPEQVTEVKRLRASGVKLKPIAIQFGITESNVCAIAKGRTWGILS